MKKNIHKLYHLALDLPWCNSRYPFIINANGVGIPARCYNSIPRSRKQYPDEFSRMRSFKQRSFTFSWADVEARIPDARANWENIPEEALSLVIFNAAIPYTGKGYWVLSSDAKKTVAASPINGVVLLNCPVPYETLRTFGECWTRLQTFYAVQMLVMVNGTDGGINPLPVCLRSLWPDIALLAKQHDGDNGVDFGYILHHTVTVGDPRSSQRLTARERMLYASPDAMRAWIRSFAARYDLAEAKLLPSETAT